MSQRNAQRRWYHNHEWLVVNMVTNNINITVLRVAISLAVILLPSRLQADTYTVGVEQLDYYPLYEGSAGGYRGYGRELLDLFAQYSGHTFIYQPMPVKRLFDTFIRGELDFKYPDNPYWSAAEKSAVTIHYSQSTLRSFDGLITHRQHPPATPLTHLATIRGFTAWAYANAIEAGEVTVQPVNSLDAGLSLVKAGRIPAVYANIAVAKGRLRDIDEQALVFNRDFPYTESHFFLSTQKHPAVIAQFNAFLQREQASIGALQQRFHTNVPQQ